MQWALQRDVMDKGLPILKRVVGVSTWLKLATAIQEPRMNGDEGGGEQANTERKEMWIGTFIHHLRIRARVIEDIVRGVNWQP